MTVAQVVLSLDHGGLEHLVIQLSAHLARRGIASPIFVLTDGVLVDAARRQHLDVVILRKRRGFDPRVVIRLARLLWRYRVDLLHTHNMAPLIYGTIAARLARVPAVNTRHGRAPLEAPALIWALNSRVVAVSQDARQELAAHNRIRQTALRVILNGVDQTRQQTLGGQRGRGSLGRSDIGVPPDVPVVGTVGRLSEEKDHATLLAAFRLLCDGGSAAHLVIAGGGLLQSELEETVRSLRLQDRVHLLGFRSDVPDLLPLFDLFVLPSQMEGVSLTLIEAMAAGLPVVATRVGGNPEVVVEGESGLLVDAGASLDLADAMSSLLRDQPLRRRMGQRGRDIARDQFDIARMTDAYVALYEEVLGAGRTAR